MPHVKPRSSAGESERLWRLAGLGGTMASEIAAGTLIGWGLDRLFGTRPTLLIIGSILGVVVGLVTFTRKAMVETRRAGREASRIAATVKSAAIDEDGPGDD